MMKYMVSYLTIEKWRTYNLSIRPELQGQGGGMAVKTQRVVKVLGRQYYTQLISHIDEIDAPVVVIEPLWFTLYAEEELLQRVEKLRQAKTEKKLTLILACSEFELMRWSVELRNAIVGLVDVITCNCAYQASLFSYFGIKPDAILCDPIPCHVFQPPDQPNSEPVVLATGHVSWFKNASTVIEVFKALQKEGIQTTYIGSSDLWGDMGDPDALRLNRDLIAVTDHYHRSLTHLETANTMRTATIGLWVAWHECFGMGYAEMLATGLPVIAGVHGLAAERPCYRSGGTHAIIETIIELTTDAALWKTWSLESRHWAIDTVSDEVFLKQFGNILQRCTREI